MSSMRVAAVVVVQHGISLDSKQLRWPAGDCGNVEVNRILAVPT